MLAGVHSLYGRLAAVFVFLLCILGAGVLALTNWSHNLYYQEVTQKLNKSLAMYIVQRAPLIEQGQVNKNRVKELADLAMVVNPIVEVYVLDTQGQILAHSLPPETIVHTRIDVRPLMRTNDDFMRAAIDFDVADPLLQQSFTAQVNAGRVPVTQGFIGSAADGRTTTIGRGGSDYSASIIGGAVNATAIEIWTDVDGMMTTDPRIVPEAAKIKTISFAEASELAYFGAKVLHPATLRPAMVKDIPVYICNSRRPHVKGTAILSHAPSSKTAIKAIAFKRGITVVNVDSVRMLMAHGFLARLFEVFNRHETAVDMVATSEVSVSMTLDDTRHLDAIIADLQEFGEVTVERDRAIICLVGEQMKFTPGLASRIFAPLQDINISMISHGASAINASFVVEDAVVADAVKRLHQEFFSELDEETFEKVSD